MDDSLAIDVSHVSKSFKVFMDRGNTLKEMTIFSSRRRHEVRQVLDDVSFSVRRGEAVALIGHNGCGKSTTLKLLTRIMYPDSGVVSMRGRVSSLIELGAGFHPDMSGRENIYINASIFGLTRKEIDDRLDSIIAFSELEDYIDNPVRTYSSGMYMRLAFSVAVNVSADILLIDEILAVGDAGFQAKCFNKMRKIKQEGTTIVLVSHSMGQIEQLCDRSIWINDGKVVLDGRCEEVDAAYLDYMNRDRERRSQAETRKAIELGAKRIGAKIDIDSMRHLEPHDVTLISGFHDVELSEIDGMPFVWMAKNSATFSIVAVVDGTDGLLYLPFHVSPRLDEPLSLSVEVNGAACVGTTQLFSDGAMILPIRRNSFSVNVTVHISHLWKPAEVFGTSDPRSLGIQIHLGNVFVVSAHSLPEMGGILATQSS